MYGKNFDDSKVFHLDCKYLYVSIFQDTNPIYENINLIDECLFPFPSKNFIASSQLMDTFYLSHQMISSHPLVISVKLLVAQRISTYLKIGKLNNIAD